MIRALIDPSPDALICKRLTDRLGRDGARRALSLICEKFTNVERAALACRWEAWARPKQLPPAGQWNSLGNLAARGWGKTEALAHLITAEVMAGRAPVVTMAAQNLTKTQSVQIETLVRVAPPWFKPVYEPSKEQLHWPNGATGYAFTPEVPEAIRSPNANLAWLSELQSWPKTTREEAYSNFVFSTRVGNARLVWDATPRRGNPILKRLLARSLAHPSKHVVVRGSIYENPHIAKTALETMEIDYGGTMKGREELLGEMIDDEEEAMFKASWFAKSKRGAPEKFKRRILSIDPAITSNPKYSDATGIMDMGLGFDGQVYANENMSGVRRAEEWTAAVIARYFAVGCDLIFIENNRGGDAWEALLRAAVQDYAREKGRAIALVLLGADTPSPGHRSDTVYLRSVNAKRSKAIRAEGAAVLCEKGRVTLVHGKLGDLEERVCSFDGSGTAPDDVVDAFVHGCHELAGLSGDLLDSAAGFRGIETMGKALAAPLRPTTPQNIAALMRENRGGGRI